MKKRFVFAALVALLLPVTASAQGFGDLDSAMAALSRGFERGESAAIVAGVAEGDQVMLQFPGLIPETGFFGRDQAAFLLDKLFARAKPVQFQQLRARRVKAEGQYHITALWVVRPGERNEERELFIILKENGDGWSLASVRSASR